MPSESQSSFSSLLYTQVALPDTRDSQLPKFIVYEKTHPLWPGGKAYVFVLDWVQSNQQEFEKFVKAREIKGQTAEALKTAGELQLHPGEIVFARFKDNSDPKEDIVQVFVTNDEVLSLMEKTTLYALQDDLLGPDSERDILLTKDVNGQVIGGTSYERRSSKLLQACVYRPFGPAFQVPRNISQPNPGCNVPPEQAVDDRAFNQKIFQTFMQTHVSIIKSLPASYHQICSAHAELTGMPKLGCENNVYFNSLQINLSPCSSFGEGTTNIKTLGQFGQKHKDPLDSLLRLSIMGCLSDIPENYHPGFFFLYDLGIFIETTMGHFIAFSGLHYHGSIAPFAPENAPVSSTAIRMTVVTYPSKSLIDMTTSLPLAHLPRNGPLFITPEMMEFNPLTEQYVNKHTTPTWITQGVGMLTPKEHVEFTGHMLLKLCQFITSQFPSDYNVHIDQEKFLSSFQYSDSSGESHALSSWPLGERLAFMNGRDRQTYRTAWNYIDEQQRKYAHSLPYPVPEVTQGSMSTFQKILETRAEVHPSIFQVKPDSSSRALKIKRKKKFKANKLSIDSRDNPDIEEIIASETSECDNDSLALITSSSALPPEDEYTLDTPLLQGLTLVALHNTLTSIKQSIACLGEADEKVLSQFLNNASHIDMSLACAYMDTQPYHNRTFREVIKAWVTIQKYKRTEGTTSIFNTLQRYKIMTSIVSLWNWIQHIVHTVVEDLGPRENDNFGDSIPDWLSETGRKIYMLYALKTQTELVLQREHQPPFRNLPPLTTTIKRPSRSTYLPAEIGPRVYKDLSYLLLSWLELPSTQSKAVLKAKFLQQVTSIFGNNILFLEVTWRAFQAPQTWITGKSKYSINKLEKYLGDLVQHPLAQPDSAEKALLESIAECYAPRIRDQPDIASHMESAVKLVLKFLQHLQCILQVPVTDQNTLECGESNVGSILGPQTLRSLVKSNLDFYSPFPEMAPSRQACLNLSYGLQADFLRTHAGIFSLLVYRGITWNTSAILVDKKVRFTDIQEWQDFQTDILEIRHLPLTYICNMKAYGTPNHNRGPHNAQAYWDESSDWEDEHPTFQSFGDAICYLQSVNKKTGKTIFPEIGRLTAFLIAVDLAYAGVIPQASPTELGEFIFNNGGGSSAQLYLMKLCSETSNDTDMGEVFADLFTRVQSKLTEQQCEDFGFDIYVLEHTLCKLSRLKHCLSDILLVE